MKKITFFIILFLCIIENSFSQNIVYANLDKIIKTSIAGKNITSFFNKKNEELIKKIKNDEKLIREKEEKIISQKNILETNEFDKKIKNLSEEVKIFNNENKKQLNDINLQRDEVTKSFIIEINKILKEFAETNKIDIILSSNQMLIGKSNLDVTSDLLKVVDDKIRKFEIKK